MAGAPGYVAGELGVIGLFDLGQLLQLNGASGCLTLTQGSRKGYFFFDSGQIVNAVDDRRREGEEIAYRLFTWKTGTFEFRPEAASTVRAIECGTEALMLEAARRMDEASGLDPADGGEAARLSGNKDSFGALRAAFQKVVGEARRVRSTATNTGAPHERLEDPRDRVVYRPDQPVRLTVEGRWTRSDGEILDGAEYDVIKAGLREGVEPGTTAEQSRHWRVRRVDGRAFGVRVVGHGEGEALWVRAVGAPPPDPESLLDSPAALKRLATLADAWVVVGATAAAQADHLLAALVRLRAEQCCETIVVVTEDAAYRHAEGRGVVVQVSPDQAESVIAALGPAVVAFEAACACASRDARSLDASSVVLVSAVGSSLEALAARWSDEPGGATCAGRERVVLYAPDAPARVDARRAA